ncbi:ribosomal protection-like ABC-F family protein [Alkalicoccobacillus porphyridii]|uniref:ABC-F type ribosomal protection protein n=1 Tax=Alkalicoccobacillus porphyridii TaxID=2597270 RepID=A0A554A0W0_9BACI|nr:ABC-F type ribosomal protection protein [Alkalicoccobacillus porphyridii]TSB47329.1 ABC-F type ribosomal protection protein [Alkalicoccobacillus porphyridii]
MLFLKAEHIEKSYGGRTIFSIDSLYVYHNDRIGLVGRNGEGKSTLLTTLAGTAELDAGSIERYGSIAYIPQLEDVSQSVTAELHAKWQLPYHSNEQMSGGEQTRLKIASTLTSNAHMLIADEPTSHLDAAGIGQLERELSAYQGAMLLTSHDKQFLNRLCTVIWEIADGGVTVYEGNYDAYIEQKQLQKDKQEREYKEYIQEKDRLKQAARELRVKSDGIKKAPTRMGNSEARLHKRSAGKQKAKLNRAAEAIESRMEQLDKKERPKDQDTIVFDLAEFPVLHSKRVLQFNGCPLAIGERLLKERIEGEVKLGQRLAIVGENGSGKTTLLNLIVERRSQLSIAQPAKIGFFTQHLMNLNNQQTILENVMNDSPYNQTFVRKVLAKLAFKREDVHKKASVLSGGERMRASMAKIFLGNYNVLVLDEPTNYLDLETKEALTEVLSAYPGTIIFVSHDRDFVKKLATHQLSLDDALPVVKASNSSKRPQVIEEAHEPDLLTIEMQLTETLGRLSTVMNEEEKSKLDQQFQALLKEKKRLQQ